MNDFLFNQILDKLNSLDDKIESLDNKLNTKIDYLGEKVNDLSITSAIQSEQLAEHMKRSLANEKMIDLLTAEFKPIQEKIIRVDTLFKFIVGFLGISGSIFMIIRALFFK